MSVESAGEVRDLVLTSDFFLPAPFCLLTLLLPPLSLGTPTSTGESITQAYNLALNMQLHTSALLQTYVSDRPWAGVRGGGCPPPGPALGKGGRTRLEEASSVGPGVQRLCQLETRPQEWCHWWLGDLGQVIPSLPVLASSSAKWDVDRALADLSRLLEDSKEAPRGKFFPGSWVFPWSPPALCFPEPMPYWEI